MRSVETLANLQKFLALLDSSLNLSEMLTSVSRQLVEMFAVDHSGMLLFNEDDIEGTVIAEYPPQGAVGLKLPLTNYPLVDQLKTEHKPIAVIDAQNDPIMGNARQTMGALGIQSIVIIPLVVRGKIVGSLSLDSIQYERDFALEELNLCHVIATQIAVAIDYTFSLEAVKTAEQQAQTLREVDRVLSGSLDLDKVLSLILEQVETLLPVDGCSIYMAVDGGIQLKALRSQHLIFSPDEVVSLDKLWGAKEIFKGKTAIVVSNTENHPEWREHKGSPIKSWLGAPLIVRGEVVGILNITGHSANRFSQADIPLATDFANQAAIAIHNADLYGQATRRANLLSSIQEIGLSIAGSLNLKDVLQRVSTSVLDLLNAHHVRIFLYDAATDKFSLASALDRGGELNIVQQKTRSPRKEGLTAQVAHSGQIIAIANTSQHPLYRSLTQYNDFGAIVGVPLIKRDQVLGVFSVSYQEPHQFTPHEIDTLKLLATQAAVALENARLYQVEVKQVEQELHIARQIQKGFLPQEIPQINGWEIAAVCLPARETGGDFYEFVKRRDNRLGVAVGDVSGKSIQAAMLMSAAQSVVAAKGSDHLSPAKVMAETNRLLYDDVPEGAFVAASYALISPGNGDICFSNGGQLAPYFVSVNAHPVRLVETPGSHWPLGVFKEVVYQELTLSLKPGDMLVFFTDGLVEQHNQQAKLFGFEGVAETLEQLRSESPEVVIQTLLQNAATFANGLPPHDDVTLLVIKRMKTLE